MAYRVEHCQRISDLAAEDWDALVDQPERGAFPFLKHAFLDALEATGCVGDGTGWHPRYLLAYDESKLVGALPCFLKNHSRGEFVFDWNWADAYHQHGLAYYPKLVLAAPFSPIGGPRLLTRDESDTQAINDTLLDALEVLATSHQCSSIHSLFHNADNDAHLAARSNWLPRIDYQFHWHNRSYSDFDAFLADLKSRKRKKLRRERERVREQQFHFRRLMGHQLSDEEWRFAYQFYASTFLQKGNIPWMNEAFFKRIGKTMGENIVVVLAYHKTSDAPVAGAINFCDQQRLYGRYWGCIGEHHSLHFETCFYQGIDHCIEKGLAIFEPGAQGEHKIARGFLPTKTFSRHWIAQPQFSQAIEHYLARERRLIGSDYAEHLWSLSPFREDLTQERRRLEEQVT
ncbi:conserved hypothetical protein [gamma proteobacterium HTCC5015]|nr:conserved hypothetical protein [gamma proteobacterium HTCC5015]